MLITPKRTIIGAGRGGDYLFLENFNRYPDSTVLSGKTPVIGPAWGTTGGSIPTTTGGKLTNSGLGYAYVNLRSTPQVIGCKVSFSGGSDLTQQNMAMALSNQTPGNLQIVNLSPHQNFGPTGFTLGVFDNTSSFKSILSQNWLTPMRNDGTVYEISIGIIGDTAVITGPNGEKFSITDPHISMFYGPMAFWEPITESDGLSCQVVQAYAINNRSALLGPTTFNPNDKTADMSLSADLLTATRTGSASTAQVRSIAGRSYGNTHFEFTINSNAAASRDGIGFASLLSHDFATNLGDDFASWVIYPFFDSIFMNLAGSFTEISSGWTWPVGSVGAVEIDWLNMFAWIKQASPVLSGWNNDVLANQNPATGTGGIDLNAVNTGWPMCITYQIAGLNDSISLNVGTTDFAIPPSAGFVPFLV